MELNMKNITILFFLLSPAACTALPEKIDKIKTIRDVIKDGPAPLTESGGVEPPLMMLLFPLLMGVAFVLSAYLRKK